MQAYQSGFLTLTHCPAADENICHLADYAIGLQQLMGLLVLGSYLRISPPSTHFWGQFSTFPGQFHKNKKINLDFMCIKKDKHMNVRIMTLDIHKLYKVRNYHPSFPYSDLNC